MYHIYILQSENFPQKRYIGFTAKEVTQRLQQHNDGSIPSTRGFRPWLLIWYGGFMHKDDALAFERYLKTGSGHAFMNKRLLPCRDS